LLRLSLQGDLQAVEQALRNSSDGAPAPHAAPDSLADAKPVSDRLGRSA